MSKLLALKTHDLNNGPGSRVSVWFSGCEFQCKGCHNKEAWDFNNGYDFDDRILNIIMFALEDDMLNLSILGGEPLHDRNKAATRKIIEKTRELYPNKNIWLWSGFTLEALKNKNDEDINYILSNVDTLIDGLFEEELYDAELEYKGSSNQVVYKGAMLNV